MGQESPRSRGLAWWQREAFYEVYPRSFQDSDGDGVGDLRGLLQRLDYLAQLGVGAVWLTPFYPSPQRDFGYDVSDYCEVDPTMGTRADFDRLVAEAHRRGLRVVVDLVANHTSSEHPWFVQSRTSRTNPKRDWYVWRDPAPDGGPPNNWLSFFGGPAWTFDPASGQYYLHQFLPEQPDLNYRDPEVVEAMVQVVRFWLDRGVDGFRLDAAWLLVEDASFRDEPPNPTWRPGMRERDRLLHPYTEDQPETHEVLRQFRAVLDEYQDRGPVLIGEVYLPVPQLVRYYGSPDRPECHFPFNFALVELPPERWNATEVRRLVDSYEAALPPWAWPSWVLGNHDRPRVATRLGEEGSRLAHMLLLTLRGTPTLYYGDELGMVDGSIPPDRVRDRAGFREWGGRWSRDAARTPMQWDATAHAGFTTGEPWLPVNPDASWRHVAAQEQDGRSFLNLVRRLLRLRRAHPALVAGRYVPVGAPPGVLAYRREVEGEVLLVALNFAETPARLAAGGYVLLSTHLDREGLERDLELRPREGLVVAPYAEAR
ncbi:MAG: alpha-amylase family glycosyl hydrolase [Armatimonadota bacterium]|nr:alpha-amylase family glycosyl hydrolase [Armatimonadota bacterium]MDR7397018.1 alpha-amylase family glycosyl hydrolase [Armatimonadota bacterium]MDR7398921.1 alpha-amylase family glycosyl hydrolase [Armatimonadota bacterium]MDR7442380.1 alpha-amylase family glycosyl hydrolase [Armatimonadota bacterium]MDR7603802.1 alpha-amylase family glycosyl hydrolase [Armatimonadota bacterium]